MTVKIYTIAHIAPEMVQAWMQHLRDFDVAHPGSHFEVMTDMPKKSFREMVEALKVEPELTVTEVWERKA